jgi:thioesterase domain-containing protein
MMGPHIQALGRSMSDALAQVAATPASCEEAAYWPEVAIQTGRRGAVPVFCVPGAGDNTIGFTSLATALDPDLPFHGLQPRGLDGCLVPHSTVEAAAGAYLRAVHKASPRGPVHLIGHSFGGWIAFEMARRLHSSGQPVASLTIIDGEAPETHGGLLGAEYSAIDVMLEMVGILELAAERSLGIDRNALEALDARQRLQVLHAAVVRAGLMPARSQPAVLQGPLRTFGTALRTNYRPATVYEGPVRLVFVSDTRMDAEANRRAQQDSFAQWKRWAPNVQSWIGPGNHMTVLKKPHVHELAHWWKAGLDPLHTPRQPLPEHPHPRP